MGVISVIGSNLSNSAAELVPNLTAEWWYFLDLVAVAELLLDGSSSSLGVERAHSSLNSMVPCGEGWRRRGVMEDAVVSFFIFFIDRLHILQ